jgi:hypothetical protein
MTPERRNSPLLANSPVTHISVTSWNSPLLSNGSVNTAGKLEAETHLIGNGSVIQIPTATDTLMKVKALPKIGACFRENG